LTVEQALLSLAAAMKALEQPGLDEAEILRLRSLVRASKIYQEKFAEYAAYLRIEEELMELRKEVAGLRKSAEKHAEKGLNGSLDNAKVDLVTVRQVATKKAKQEAKDASSAVEALGILQVQVSQEMASRLNISCIELSSISLFNQFLVLRKSYSRTLTKQYAFINLSVSIP
jgi:hypothetical protein